MTNDIPHGEPASRKSWLSGGRLLAVGAIALLLFGAFFPIFGVPVGRGFQILAMIAVVTATFGGLIAPHGSRLAFMLLWTAFGMSAAIGTIGFFSVGLLYLIAAIFLLFAIFATPNHSEIELSYDMRYIAAFAIGYLGMFFIFFVFAARF